MSVEITLSLVDYKKILGWFELAFAKTNDVPTQDSNTFRKISVMAQITMEEQEEHRDDRRTA